MKKLLFAGILISLLQTLAACGSGPSGESGGLGGITATAVWPGSGTTAKAGVVSQKVPPEVVWVRMIVSNVTTTVQADFAAAAGSGSISGVPAGSGWTLTFQGLNAAKTTTLFQGARSGITVSGGATTNAGSVSMYAVSGISGQPDTSFDGDGKLASSDSPVVPGDQGAYHITMTTQGDGKIVISGDTTIRNTAASPQVFVARYNTDGTLDSSFNDADTYANKTAGIATRATPSTAWGSDVTIMPDGSIVVAGTTEHSPSNRNFMMMTFSSSGTYSSGFNAFETDFGGVDTAKAMAVNLSSGLTGTIAVVGTSNIAGNARLALALYSTSTSSLISKTTTTIHSSINYIEANDVAFQADGKILVAGQFRNTSGSFGFGLARFLGDGVTVDASFNAAVTPGLVFTQYVQGGPTTYGATAVAVQPDGKILIAGDVDWGAGSPQFGVLRFNPDGTKDTTFNPAGVPPGEVLVDVNNQGDFPRDLKVQPDGKILIAGWSGTSMSIARLNADGSVDAAFGTNGGTTIAFAVGTMAAAANLSPDGKIVLAGKANGPGLSWYIARLWNDVTTKGRVYGVENGQFGVTSTWNSSLSVTTPHLRTVQSSTSSALLLMGLSLDAAANRLYTRDSGTAGHRVYVIDTINNMTIAEIIVSAPSPSAGGGIAVYSGTNRAYANMNDAGAGSTVAVIDTSTNTVIATIPGFNGPTGMALDAASNRLYVANGAGTTVSVVDTVTNTIVSTLTGFSNPNSPVYDASTGKLFVVNQSAGTVTAVTIATGARTVMTVDTGPNRTALDSAAQRMYVVNYDGGNGNTVSVINTATNTVMSPITTAFGPRTVRVDSAAKRLYVDCEGDQTIHVYNVLGDANNEVGMLAGGYSNMVVAP